MSTRQLVFALLAGLALLAFVIELVRRRKLREEYSWLWILTAVGVLVLSAWYRLLEWLTYQIGAVVPASTLFVFGILFLLAINIHFSIQISTLTTQVKNQAQRLAILDAYVRESRMVEGDAEPECTLSGEQPTAVTPTRPIQANAEGLAAQELS